MRRNCEPDDIISLFTQCITDRANPYFDKHYSQRLKFTDDAVIFSDTIAGLQSSHIYLEMFCTKWNLNVNIDKTKIVILRK